MEYVTFIRVIGAQACIIVMIHI